MNLLLIWICMISGALVPLNDSLQFENAPLPFATNALEPLISQKTVEIHYGKHQQSYIDNLNRLKKGTQYDGVPIETIVLETEGPLYNNASQAWNHAFYFQGLTSPAQSTMSETLRKNIESQFGSVDSLQHLMVGKGATRFGSGWVWLVVDRLGNMLVITTANADSPIKEGLIPLLVFDVWEHAYYLDYLNKRANHLESLWKIVNWDVVENRLKESVRKCNKNSVLNKDSQYDGCSSVFGNCS